MGRGNRRKNKKNTNIVVIEKENPPSFENQSALSSNSNTSNECNISITSNISSKSNTSISISSMSNSMSNIISKSDASKNNVLQQEIPPINISNNKLEKNIYEKMDYVNNFVNYFWDRIYDYYEVEDIIIENESDNESDDLIYDEY